MILTVIFLPEGMFSLSEEDLIICPLFVKRLNELSMAGNIVSSKLPVNIRL